MACYATRRHYVEAFRLGVDETPNWFDIKEGSNVELDKDFNLYEVLAAKEGDKPVKQLVGSKGDFIIKLSDSNFNVVKAGDFLDKFELAEA